MFGHLDLVLNDAVDSSLLVNFDLGDKYIDPLPNLGVNFMSNLPCRSFERVGASILSGLSDSFRTNRESST